MLCLQKKKLKFMCFFLSFLISFLFLFVNLSIGVHCEEVENNNSSWTDDQKREFINGEVFHTVLDCFTFILPGGASYSDIKQDMYELTATNAIQNNMTYDEYLLQKCNLQIGDNGEVESVTISPDYLNDVQTVVNAYIQENPLPYTYADIYSTSFIGAQYFNTWQKLNNYINDIKENTQGDYVLCFYATTSRQIKKGNSTSNIPSASIWFGSIKSEYLNYPIEFYSSTGNLVSNVRRKNFEFRNDLRLSINWLSSIADVAPYIDWYYVYDSDMSLHSLAEEYPNYYPNPFGDLYNSEFTNNTSTSNFSIHYLGNKKQAVTVFDNINELKKYNSGQAQPYYLGTGFNADKIWYTPQTISGGTVANHQDSYEYIVNNIQSGWSAQQVLDLVDKVTSISGSGSSSSSDKENPFGFLGKLGEVLGDLISGIGDLVTEVADSIKDVVLNLIGLLIGENGLISKLKDLVNTDFNGFLSDVFSWLPPEIITLFTSSLIFGIFFAIWKMIRG